MTSKTETATYTLISYKNPNPKLDKLTQELSRLCIEWSIDPDPSQPLLERVTIVNIEREQALKWGQTYSCSVWKSS